MAVPTLDQSGSGSVTTATGTLAVTTTGANEIIILAISCCEYSQPSTPNTTVSGGGLTWIKYVSFPVGYPTAGSHGVIDIWYAIAPTAVSAATITIGGAGGTYPSLCYSYASFSGVSTSTPFDPGSTFPATDYVAIGGTPAATVSTTEANTTIIGVLGGYSSGPVGSLIPSGTSSIVSVTGGSVTSNFSQIIETPNYISPTSGITAGTTGTVSFTGLILIGLTSSLVPPTPPEPFESPWPAVALHIAQQDDLDITYKNPLTRARAIPNIGPSALVLADRVMEKTNTTGTGTVICSGPVAQYQPFTVIGAGNTTWYAIISGDGVNWETGIGTITQLNPSGIARTTVLSSSNGGALISLAGVSTIICDLPAEKVQTTTPTPTPPPFSQIVPIAISSTPVSITLGGAAANWYPSVGTFTFNAGQLTAFVGRLRRSATTVGLSLGLSKNGGSQGYLATSQNDGNLVQYYNIGSGTVLISAANNSPGYGARTNFASTSLMRWFISIAGTSNNIMWVNKDTCVAADTANTNFDLTSGNWTLYVSANSYSDIQSVIQNIAPEYGS